MPATEKTWRDQKIMHVVFGCTGLMLLISTVWMFAADHGREWKNYQRTNRKVDTTLTSWRMADQQTRENQRQLEEIETELAASLASAPSDELIGAFTDKVSESYASESAAIQQLHEQLAGSSDDAEKASLRKQLLKTVDRVVRDAKFREDNMSRARKFKSADFDEVRANRDLGVRDNLSTETIDQLQEHVQKEKEARMELTHEAQAAKKLRESLQSLQTDMLSNESGLRKKLEDAQAEYNRLASALDERSASYFTGMPPFLGKKWLELPIFDAFNSPLKIDNLWTDGLTITNGSFGQVTRFDRCTTCHQNVEKTAPGSAVTPAFENQHEVTLTLQMPESKPASSGDQPLTLVDAIGIGLAANGLIDVNDVTIKRVIPQSPAALAEVVDSEFEVSHESNGLLVGDVLTFVDGDEVLSTSSANQMLLRDVDWGAQVEIKVQRGLPHPFSSHPRLDLYVGSMSPHKLAVFGCSICHEGQGSATEFKNVSHTPDNPEQEKQWAQDYGWFNNHHWIYPMYPDRFSESSCLKCHHEVVELQASERFPEPPAPKLTHGYDLIRRYGCFGCHEINGYNGPDQRIGPDMRLEPNYFAAAAQLKADPKFDTLSTDVRGWTDRLIHNPELDSVRHRLANFIKDDSNSEAPILTETSHKMASVLDDADSPGKFRKVGPSLRYVREKLGKQFLYDWIRDPKSFRPNTRMPAFFGHWDHLQAEPSALQQSKDFEPIEILGVVEFLLDRSQKIQLEGPDSDLVMSAETVERGKVAFETRGCMACHKHDEIPAGKSIQGPDLSNIGDKFALSDTPNAATWMYSWLKNPSNYHSRTKMPNLYLDPQTDADGNTTDPAADIATFLLSSKKGWQPEDLKLTPDKANLEALVNEHLRSKIFETDAADAIANRKIPDEIAVTLKGAERELIGEEMTDQMMLMYVGSKTISKFGCYACHDIPGFEDAKPIGAALAEWGRKDPSKLAFEHIVEYLHHGGHGHHGDEHATDEKADAHGESEQHIDKSERDENFDESFYTQRIEGHDRVGFIWQKLKEPRSYDYQKASNKDYYNDRLRMPLFPFNNEEREAVISFVIGLVAEPPAHKFVYHPDERQQAMIAGKKALEKYNCGGCHILEAEKWELAIKPDAFDVPELDADGNYPFMMPHATTEELAASKVADKYSGLITAHLSGMPDVNPENGQIQLYGDGEAVEPEDLGSPDFDEYAYKLRLWEPAIVDGKAAAIGAEFEVPVDVIRQRSPAVGGDLTFQLMGRVTEIEQEVTPAATIGQSFAWLPPPLIGEGSKVQSDWLHDFLLEPYPIRPATFLRMPKFNMSSQEATDLVSYFAAKDNATYPYEYSSRSDATRLAATNRAYIETVSNSANKPKGEGRLDHAMNIVTSQNYCVKCHLVGDFEPKGHIRALAPNLADVQERLRPEYVRRWIAAPNQILPYTQMPVNLKYDANAENSGGVDQSLYHGTSVEQLDGLVDLLMNYSTYTSERANVSDLVQPAPTEGDAATGASR